jgi:hypothetical protein
MNCERPRREIRWPLVRVQPGHETQVELLSGYWLRLATHYAGRTLLCTESEACALCSVCPSRFYWYLPCCQLPGRTPAICEFSASTSSMLEQNAKMLHGSLGAGMQIRLARKAAKKPVYVEVIGYKQTSVNLSFQEWASALMAVFGLPGLRPDESIANYGERVEGFILQRAELAYNKMKLASVGGVKRR